jgi:hypothetical protein
MIEEVDFETFLYVSRYKYEIFVLDKTKQENLYKEEKKIQNDFNFQDLNDLPKFLDIHIYKIEKIVGNFIKNIILILESDEILHVNIGIKKKNYNNSLNKNYLESNLKELKDLFRENYQEQTIMHMVITNYIINGERYASFKSDLMSNHFSLEVNFISISNELVLVLEKVLEKYQIKISQYKCGSYIKSFFNEDNDQISQMTNKLINGYNINEVLLVPKNIDNKGFFEKFFQLFS